MLAALFAWSYAIVIMILMGEAERFSGVWWLGAAAATWMAFAGAMAGWINAKRYE
ncbi:hypothetical protein UFOVP609_33 [uncultured Caudovirales phage]|uniref:Uncharacterized protein n=1 Tax=uncultured Caudovirales phage TaxID=2100421 RepID=A0A6J5N4E5_9CAUD|nr:hypothetical protein UFOVP609_33 [uncultured Caudovirales phage]